MVLNFEHDVGKWFGLGALQTGQFGLFELGAPLPVAGVLGKIGGRPGWRPPVVEPFCATVSVRARVTALPRVEARGEG